MKSTLPPFVTTYQGHKLAGVDEVGRGPLAGDVVACAVILDPSQSIDGLNDSKALTEKKRERLYEDIRSSAIAYGVGRASVQEIDEINILNASLLAMTRAVEALAIKPEHVLVDGNKLPNWSYSSEAVVKGDSRVPVISAASIMAKVIRDRELIALDEQYPGYGLAKHKGYPTKAHIKAIHDLGVLPIHRRSFAPVARCLNEPAHDG